MNDMHILKELKKDKVYKTVLSVKATGELFKMDHWVSVKGKHYFYIYRQLDEKIFPCDIKDFDELEKIYNLIGFRD